MQACISIRKQGKKLAVYDLKLVFTWKGQMSRPDAKPVEGVVKISEYANESDEDDWVVECSTTETGTDAVRADLLCSLGFCRQLSSVTQQQCGLAASYVFDLPAKLWCSKWCGREHMSISCCRSRCEG